METILITGSNGLLGQKLLDKLRAKGAYKVIASSKGHDRYPRQEGYIYESLDVTNSAEVDQLIGKYQPEVIINTAAMTNVDACENDRENCYQLNVKAVEYLLAAAKKIDANLVHLSTDFIFDGENGPYREEDAPNPLSYYGQTKLEAEQVLQNSGYKNWSILRTIIVYGVAANMSRSNIVLWAKSALEKGDKINVIDDQFRSPTLAEDLADACLLAANKKAQGVYHISGKDIMSIIEMVERIADHFKLDKSLIQRISSSTLNQAAKRPPRTGFILDKAIKELGYTPHSFEEGLDIVAKQLA